MSLRLSRRLTSSSPYSLVPLERRQRHELVGRRPILIISGLARVIYRSLCGSRSCYLPLPNTSWTPWFGRGAINEAFLHRRAPRLSASRKRKLRPFRRLISTIFSTPLNCDHTLLHRLAPRLSASRKMGVRPFRRLISKIFSSPPNCDNAFLHRLPPRLSASRKMGVRPFRRLIRLEDGRPSFPTADQVAKYFQAPPNCDNAFLHRLPPRLSASRKMGVRPFRRLIRLHNIFKPLRTATTRFFIVWPHGFLRLGRWERPSFPTADQHNIFKPPSKLRQTRFFIV
ncbi:unnamed protein product [Caenorhabditis auriculariae]|uniref:Uncharacterized protein n=1 Tax=Caenorhabditis auriculariae TaxID=2777116 RepID=A0A8S1H6V5_9PELO|nr:unnamed protein product [Caenorhabditis auriculariae]